LHAQIAHARSVLDMKTPTFDVKGVIKKFGGRAQLYRKLCLAKIQISPRTLDNWVVSGIIPLHRLLQLVAIAKEDGTTLKIDDYIKNDKPSRNDSSADSGKNGKPALDGAVH